MGNKTDLTAISKMLLDKGYVHIYRGGMFLELDNPFYVSPRITLMYDIKDFFPLVPEHFHDKLKFLGEKSDTGHEISIIKSNKTDVNNTEEFADVQSEFLELMAALVNELPINPITFTTNSPIPMSFDKNKTSNY